jgi:SAM-dependent methyltransferase
VTNWKAVWEKRTLDPAASVLSALMAADGLDTGYGSVAEESWREFVVRTGARLGLGPGTSLYEVGCGAGAFLYELHKAGVRVAGLDASATLCDYARRALQGAPIEHLDAAALPVQPPAEVVVSCGVFLYFPSLEYARSVLQRMAAKAQRALALLDVTDKAREGAALQARRASLGPEEYERRYAGLPHLYYERGWIEAELRALGFARVEIEDQRVQGYANALYRFNAFAWR